MTKTGKKFLPYAHQTIEDSDVESVVEALKGNIITRGPKVESFEKAMAEYCGALYAVAFNSATSALIGACQAADVNAHDRIVTSPNTFIATVTAGMRFGATPFFVDIDRTTGNWNLEQLESNMEFFSTRGRSIYMPVHFSGILIDMPRMESMLQQSNTIIIEDAAHALGSVHPDGKKVGCCEWSDMAVFSFHPAKTITTGEGGMVLTNDITLYRRLKLFRNNGIEREAEFLVQPSPGPWYYEVQEMGNNFNLTEFQATLGLSQMQRLDGWIMKRRELVSTYRKLLKDTPNLRLFTDAFDATTAFHIFVVQIDFSACNTTRATVMQKLLEKDIGTQVHYIPLYKHPLFQKRYGDMSEYFPETEAYYEQALSLPLYPTLTTEDVEYVCSTLKSVL